jgi:hypothetical protein
MLQIWMINFEKLAVSRQASTVDASLKVLLIFFTQWILRIIPTKSGTLDYLCNTTFKCLWRKMEFKYFWIFLKIGFILRFLNQYFKIKDFRILFIVTLVFSFTKLIIWSKYFKDFWIFPKFGLHSYLHI